LKRVGSVGVGTVVLIPYFGFAVVREAALHPVAIATTFVNAAAPPATFLLLRCVVPTALAPFRAGLWVHRALVRPTVAFVARHGPRLVGKLVAFVAVRRRRGTRRKVVAKVRAWTTTFWARFIVAPAAWLGTRLWRALLTIARALWRPTLAALVAMARAVQWCGRGVWPRQPPGLCSALPTLEHSACALRLA
jgi:hypothetical protein